MPVPCRQRLEAVRKKHTALKQQLEGEFGQLDSLEAKVRGRTHHTAGYAAYIGALQ